MHSFNRSSEEGTESALLIMFTCFLYITVVATSPTICAGVDWLVRLTRNWKRWHKIGIHERVTFSWEFSASAAGTPTEILYVIHLHELKHISHILYTFNFFFLVAPNRSRSYWHIRIEQESVQTRIRIDSDGVLPSPRRWSSAAQLAATDADSQSSCVPCRRLWYRRLKPSVRPSVPASADHRRRQHHQQSAAAAAAMVRDTVVFAVKLEITLSKHH